MTTHNIRFHGEIRKIIYLINCLSRSMIIPIQALCQLLHFERAQFNPNVMLNKLRCYAHFLFSANQIT